MSVEFAEPVPRNDSLGRRAFVAVLDGPPKVSQAKIATMLDVGANSVTQWKKGDAKPTAPTREIIQAHWPHIRIALWDEPFIEGHRVPTANDPAPRPSPPELPSEADAANLSGSDLETILAKLASYEAGLPAAQAWRCSEAAGRLRLAHEKAVNERRTAVQKWLTTPEFQAEIAEVYRLMSPEFGPRLGELLGERYGLDAPPVEVSIAPPSIETIRSAIRSSAELRGIGELLLAAAQIIKLDLSHNTAAVARLLVDQGASQAEQILDALMAEAPQETARLRKALDTLFAIEDVKRLSDESREAIVSLLQSIDRVDIAAELV